MIIHGKEYMEVKDRLPLLYEKYPTSSVHADVIWHNPDFTAVCIKAYIRVRDEEGEREFTGIAYEERTPSNVNSTSWVENAETSAIGRALANMNIGVNGQRPSAEEMQKVERMSGSPKDRTTYEVIEMLLAYAIAENSIEALQKFAEDNMVALNNLPESKEKESLRKKYQTTMNKLKGKK